MLNRNFFVLAFLVVFGSFLVAFSNAKSEAKTVYEYVTIWQNDNWIYVIEQGKKTTEEFVKKDRLGLNASFETINKYEMQGYELFQSNMSSSNASHIHSFLLRRKRP